jgi:hypothetical protein
MIVQTLLLLLGTLRNRGNTARPQIIYTVSPHQFSSSVIPTSPFCYSNTWPAQPHPTKAACVRSAGIVRQWTGCVHRCAEQQAALILGSGFVDALWLGRAWKGESGWIARSAEERQCAGLLIMLFGGSQEHWWLTVCSISRQQACVCCAWVTQ